MLYNDSFIYKRNNSSRMTKNSYDFRTLRRSGDSLIISIPKHWLRELEWKEGEELILRKYSDMINVRKPTDDTKAVLEGRVDSLLQPKGEADD